MSLRHALRALFKTPFISTVAILSLALGIGANAAIFSVFNQEVGWITVVGGLIGLTTAIVVGRLGRALLFDLHKRDPWVLSASTVLLALVALGAGALPALRASRVDPMHALRAD